MLLFTFYIVQGYLFGNAQAQPTGTIIDFSEVEIQLKTHSAHISIYIYAPQHLCRYEINL